MIWEFKRQLYCTAERVSVAACPDLSDPILQERLQRHCDATRRFPPRGSDDEYAAYFEAVYQNVADRQRYILRAVRDGKPSFGHVVLGTLLLIGSGRVVWTTNFDSMIEDATLALLEGSSRLTVASIETADVARTALTEGRDPIIIKLHGDFRSRQLKNIESELRAQDATLRRALVDECRRAGLAVIGYSGRDQSVMDALREAIDEGRGYPSGLFWFHRDDSPPSKIVEALIQEACAVGIDAHLVKVETFDELMGDIIALCPTLPDRARVKLQALDRRASRVSDAPAPVVGPRGGVPLVRLNAFPVLEAPAVCRRIGCSLGGIKEVREAIHAAGVPLIAIRRKTGIHVFGRDDDCRRAFGPFAITDFDVQPIESRPFAYDDSQEIGMMTEAIAHAIARERPLLVTRRGRSFQISVDPTRAKDPSLAPLMRAAKGVSGKVRGTDITWAEGVRLFIRYRYHRLWLILEPRIWHSDSEDKTALGLVRAFARERLTSRYNRAADEVLTGWIECIAAGATDVSLSTFGFAEGAGIDAKFVLGRRSGFSRRQSALPTRLDAPSPYRDSQ